MARTIINPGNSTPEVILDTSGQIVIKGRLVSEDPTLLFGPVTAWIKENVIGNDQNTFVIEISLEYINSAGMKSLLEMFQCMGSYTGKLEVIWRYEKCDEDMIDKGFFISSIVMVPFKFHEI